MTAPIRDKSDLEELAAIAEASSFTQDGDHRRKRGVKSSNFAPTVRFEHTGPLVDPKPVERRATVDPAPAPNVSEEVAPPTPVTSYTELIKAIDAERVAIGIRHLDFEVLCSMTQGHWGKAAGMLQVKKLGIEKIFDALRAAGLRIRLEIDPDQRAKMLARIDEQFNPMQSNQARPKHSSTLPSTPVLNRVMQPWRKIGGKKRWAGKSKKERSEHCRMMAMARVRKQRKRRKSAMKGARSRRDRLALMPEQTL